MQNSNKMIDRTVPYDRNGDVDAEAVLREDFVIEARDRSQFGKPRLLALKNYDHPFVRIVPAIDRNEHASRRGAEDRRDKHVVNRLITSLTQPQFLVGPGTVHEIDELAATLFEDSPNFSEAIQAIRQSAQSIIRGGARWMQFRPIVIQSPPGLGKTRLAYRLSELSGLPIVYLDCATMNTLTPILSQDSSWSGSRVSEIVEALGRHNIANVLVVLDELDKLRDHGRNGSAVPSEALVGLLEQRSAAAHLDHFTQLTIDFSFLNWLILVNDLDRLSRPLLDRCQVIRMQPPSVPEIESIASREISRRGLEPELVTPIVKAVRRGRINSLRKLHKLLDAAAASSSRPFLN